MPDRPAGGEAGSVPARRRSTAVAGGLLLVALAVAAVLLARGGGESAPQEPAVAVGFSNNAVAQGVATPAQAAERLAQAGADVDRVQINWATLEPSQGAYDFAVYDQIYEADLAAGIRPLFVFAYAPPWAAGDACDAAVPSCHLPPTPAHYEDAAVTAATIAERYPEAAGIEIWNEPNIPYFWVPAADPAAYADLLEVAAEAIRRVDPEMPVAGSSTSSSTAAGRPGYLDALDFISAIYEDGAAESLDALSIHLYPGAAGVEAARAQLEQIRAVQGDYGDPAPLWVTETGISSTGPSAVGEPEQATILASLVDEIATAPGVEMVLVHTLFAPSSDPSNPEAGYGIIGPDGQPKVAFCQLAAEWGGDGC